MKYNEEIIIYKEKIRELENRNDYLNQELENLRILNKIYKEESKREKDITDVLLENIKRKGKRYNDK